MYSKKGILYSFDLEVNGIVENIINLFKFDKLYVNAIIKGLKFCGRGLAYVDDSESLFTDWDHNIEKKCWIKITDYKIDKSNENSTPVIVFGKLNYLIPISLSSDPLLDGLCFANTSIVDSSYDPKRHHYCLQSNSNPKITNLFYCVNYINATRLGLSAIHKNLYAGGRISEKNFMKPINSAINPLKKVTHTTKADAKKKLTKKDYHLIFCREDEDIDFIYFLELESYCEKVILFDSIDKDIRFKYIIN